MNKPYHEVDCLNKLVESLVEDSNPDDISITRNEDGDISKVVYSQDSEDGESVAYETYVFTYNDSRKIISIDITYGEVI